MEYSVKLTEREIKDLGVTRWQHRVRVRLAVLVLGVLVWLVASMAIAQFTDAPAWLGAIIGLSPACVFAVWFVRAAQRAGMCLLEEVEREVSKQAD